MPLSPLDIHNKEFRRVFRGYDEAEVDEFLDKVVEDYKQLLRDNQQLKESVKELEDKLAHYYNLEQTLHNAIVVAQETAEEVKANAKKEAQIMIREAELKSQNIIEEALEKVRKISQEVDELRRNARVYRSRLKNLLKAQLEMLEEDDWQNLEKEIDDSTRAFELG